MAKRKLKDLLIEELRKVACKRAKVLLAIVNEATPLCLRQIEGITTWSDKGLAMDQIIFHEDRLNDLAESEHMALLYLSVTDLSLPPPDDLSRQDLLEMCAGFRDDIELFSDYVEKVRENLGDEV
jgi:hypothetical protein